MSKSRGRCTTQSRLLGLLGLFAAGCGGNVSRDPGTVLYASGADLQSINSLIAVHPLAKQVQKNVLFMTLLAYDSAMRPIPRLATPEWSRDRRSVTLRLPRDVFWHDSVPTTAADVKWTLDM